MSAPSMSRLSSNMFEHHSMNILYLDATRSLYGASRMLLTLLEDADRLRITPFVVMANDVQDDLRLVRELDRLGIKQWEYPITVLRRQKYLNARGALYMAVSLVKSVPFLLRLIREHKIDLVQSNTSTILSGAIAARLAGVPHVWHVHELLRKWEGRVLVRLMNALSTSIVAPSDAVAHNLVEAQSSIRRKLSVIKNGLDLALYRTVSPEEVARLRAAWGIGVGEQVVGMIGRIGMWKGEDQFVEVARRVLDAGVAAKFVIVGGVFDDKARHLTRLRQKIEDLRLAPEKQVVVAGLRGDIPAVVNLLDVLVHLPVRPEPFGLVAVEAMAAGRPVVAAALGGLKEIVVDGQTGFMVDAGDVAGAAARVVTLLQNPALGTEMGRAGSQRADAEFSSRAYADRFNSLYRKLLARTEGVEIGCQGVAGSGGDTPTSPQPLSLDPPVPSPQPQFPTDPVVVAVILNWNNLQLTLDTLASLRGQTYTHIRTVVIDNGSHDGGEVIEAVRTQFPHVVTWASKVNLGFARGCNVGMKLALRMGADYVLLLNNDVLLHPDAISHMIHALESDKRAGAACPFIFYASEPDKVWFAGGKVQMGGRVLPMHMLLAERLSLPPDEPPRESEWLAGTSLLVRRSAIEKAGMMDPAYFLYWEDVDWCFRLRRAGYSLLLVPRSRIWHRVNATAGTLPSLGSVYYWERNRLRFIEKWGTWGSRLTAWAKILSRSVTWRIRLPEDDPEAQAKLEAYRDYLLRRFGPRKAMSKSGKDLLW